MTQPRETVVEWIEKSVSHVTEENDGRARGAVTLDAWSEGLVETRGGSEGTPRTSAGVNAFDGGKASKGRIGTAGILVSRRGETE